MPEPGTGRRRLLRITPESRALIGRLLGYMRPYRRIVYWSLIAAVLHAFADAALPYLVTQVIERLQDTGRSGAPAWQIPLAIVLLFPFRGCMDFLAVYGLNQVGRSVVRDWRREMFAHYLGLPVSYHDRAASGELLAKLTYNTEQVGDAISGSVVVIMRDTLTIVLLFGWMVYLSPRLTLIVLVVGPIVGLLVSLMTRAFRRYSARIQTSIGDVTRVAEQFITGHRVVRIFAGQRREQERFDTINRNNFRLNTRVVAVRALGTALTQLTVACGIAAVIYAAFSDWVLSDLDAPEFVGFLGAMGMLFAPLRRLTNVNAVVQRGLAAAESVFAILDEPAERDQGGRAIERAAGEIEFRHVSFGYASGDGPALREVDLRVPAGTSLALVGRSGSGKSTLANLLPRFYAPSDGAILLDGEDIQSYRLTDLRRQISIVTQDTILFDDSIANNIAYGGLADATRAAIEQAAEAAHVMDFAAALPNGLDTRVGERGALLSGGQRQRVAIARALLKDAPVLILDEATSALDSESERHIQEAIERLVRDRTTLVIAHRLSTIERADQIAVMHEGRIVELGTHTALLARAGHYAALYRLQFSGEAPAP